MTLVTRDLANVRPLDWALRAYLRLAKTPRVALAFVPPLVYIWLNAASTGTH